MKFGPVDLEAATTIGRGTPGNRERRYAEGIWVARHQFHTMSIEFIDKSASCQQIALNIIAAGPKRVEYSGRIEYAVRSGWFTS
jgi:hypothetical protein